MINENFINTLLKSIIPENIYIVELKLSNAPKISLFIDSFEGVTIKDCQTIHKKLATEIREHTDDFLLDVSSPGITSKLIVWQQYAKLLNQKINITTAEGENFNCTINKANEEQIEVLHENNETLTISYNKIKKAKPIIEF